LGDPFTGTGIRQLSPNDMLRALRIDIAGELEAVLGYEAHIESTGDARVKKVLSHIADEERSHIGELEQLIFILSPAEDEKNQKGRQSVESQQRSGFTDPMD
jgi:rubrerythrin